MSKEELLEAANAPATEQDLIDYRNWRKECEKEFEAVQKMHDGHINWQEGV